ncbi:TDT family transporter [Granulicatella elegans]|uniref:TDT family transporter n=1 Tax=Granulicatella elegans TaxID=137732 RepID=UPI001D141CAE|nr:TDT family transporter [Granulicatella elegans]UEA30900.1 TDT family transporter [Granulicatella elegans]
MKKLPLAFSGCLLGLAGAGNLISDTLPELSHVFSVLGLGLWIIFLISHLLNWQNTANELKKPPVLSGMATFPMAGMILATYLLRTVPSVPLLAQVLWWFSFLLDIGLITYFTIQLLSSKEKIYATPSWTVLYVGIAVAALTYPVVRIIEIAYATIIFGFILTFYLYPRIYKDLKKRPLPNELLGQEGIYCAPFSLLLASLVRVGGHQLLTYSIIMMIISSQIFFFLVLSRLPQILKQGFQPAFSSLTFPTIVTATSLKMAQGILQFPLLNLFVTIEVFISLTILIFVLFSYLVWMKKSSS